MLREGALDRQARKTRRIYQARRDLLAGLLRQNLGEYMGFSIPAGGLALWPQIKPGLDAERCSQAAGRFGLAVARRLAYFLDVAATSQAFRLGFANLDDDELRRSVQLPHRAFQSI